MKITAKFEGVVEFQAQLKAFATRDERYASVQALNRLAFGIREEWKSKAVQVLDRPTALTRNSVLYRKATMSGVDAVIFIRDEAFKGTPPAKYLTPQVSGGSRRLKRFERALQAAGLMPTGTYAMPGGGAKLDSHGNLSGATITRILSALRANPDPLSNRPKKGGRRASRAPQYFAVTVRRGRLVPGIYQRFQFARGTAVKPILVFVRPPRYSVRYNVFGFGQAYLDANLQRVYQEELAKAVAATFARNAKT